MNFDFTGKRVALIGGAGFIGHNIAVKLQELGAEPHIIDSLQVNNLGAFTHQMNENPNDKLYIGFINERLDLLRKSDSTVDHSMRTLENALDCVRDRKPHFIYFSSSMIYGDFGGEAVTEDRPGQPLGIYGALKYAGEKLVIAYNQVFGVPYTIVRPSALYGERCVSRRVGQAFIENAIRGLDVTINGDGNDCLDFTYIGDLVQGIVRCIAKEEARNQIFNLTYGRSRSLNLMADIIREHFPNTRVVHNARDSLMPERGTLNVEKARRLLGYEPAYPLETGYVSYINWYKKLAAEKPALFALQSK